MRKICFGNPYLWSGNRSPKTAVLLHDLLQVLKTRLPHLRSITMQHAESLYKLTAGGNLKLVSLALNEVHFINDLVQLKIGSIAQKVQHQYISGLKHNAHDKMRTLCALGMFDITPMSDYLDLSEETLATGLVTRLFSPERLRFCHSSLAEVMFYVLVELKEGDLSNWNDWC